MNGKKCQRALTGLGRELKDLRRGRGLTLEQASRLARISRSTVQRIESGDGSVALNTLFAYASSIDLQDSLVKAMVSAVRAQKRLPFLGLSEFEMARLALDDLVAGK